MRPGDALRQRVEECAQRVGLPLGLLPRFPHQLSGGQKARIGIARAIACRPRLLVLDEPTAALDVSVQAVVLQLLDRLRREDNLAFLFVSHDLNVVRMMCDHAIVLRNGCIVEQGESRAVFGTHRPLTHANWSKRCLISRRSGLQLTADAGTRTGEQRPRGGCHVSLAGVDGRVRRSLPWVRGRN
jgi:ABC-type glutathione transport system ATPase component